MQCVFLPTLQPSVKLLLLLNEKWTFPVTFLEFSAGTPTPLSSVNPNEAVCVQVSMESVDDSQLPVIGYCTVHLRVILKFVETSWFMSWREPYSFDEPKP